jgi:hypothetical protein
VTLQLLTASYVIVNEINPSRHVLPFGRFILGERDNARKRPHVRPDT